MRSSLIQASAGTGKTYRLSLEFINILATYRVDFEEILVITFTKKATAEIRERIFQHLSKLLGEEQAELLSNLQKINKKFTLNATTKGFLQQQFERMLTNKQKLNISTIDAYINNVFSTLIAPYYNITDYQIDNQANQELLPEIYEYILQDGRWEKYEAIFAQAKQKNLDSYGKLINDIINNRWLFEFVGSKQCTPIPQAKLQQELQILLEIVAAEAIRKGNSEEIDLQKYLNKTFYEACQKAGAGEVMSQLDFQVELPKLLTEKSFLQENYKLLLAKGNYWNGNKLFNDKVGKERKPELLEQLELVKQILADYLLYELVLPEQERIINLALEVLQIHDQLKFVEKKFTHFDINYYTYRFIYDPEISLIDGNQLLNIFTESLSYRSRFILIDEFQDTSVLQWRIFQPVINEIVSGIGQKDYGGVTVVGDEKQAIYGWRGGEKDLLANVQQMVNTEFDTATLATSYRSKTQLIDFINTVFGKLQQYPPAAAWKYNEVRSKFSEPGYVKVIFQNRKGPGEKQEISQQELYLKFVDEVITPAAEQVDLKNSAILARNNNTLQEIALALEKRGIEYILESSASLFEHKAVKNLLFLLKFLCYEDPLELVKFLRSDAVLLASSKLKYYLQTIHTSWENFWELSEPLVVALKQVKDKKESLLELLTTAVDIFNLPQVYSTELDRKNLHQFWLVAAEFLQKDLAYTKNLAGFLSYLRDLTEKEEYSQLGESSSQAITLLTIHKSKGLQFETVFSVIGLDSNRGHNTRGLNFYYEFNQDYSELQDYFFTYNYDTILQNCSDNKVIQHIQKREYLEELNNYYVAITRAANNLVLFCHFKKKGSLEEFLKRDEPTPEQLLAQIIYSEYKFEEVNDTTCQMQKGSYLQNSEPEPEERQRLHTLQPFCDILHWQYLVEREPVNLHQLQTEFIEDQSIMKGNIIHYYLAQIDYDSQTKRKLAQQKTAARYGTLFPKPDFLNLIAKANQFLQANASYYQPGKWDKIFNEYALWDQQGREFRLDRLQIDSSGKQILIVDYKTGHSYEEKQLEKYAELIGQLPVVQKQGYEIKTKFLKIDL
jgi:ATP-dependent exoDNAse (exonuclease V) beta subunit